MEELRKQTLNQDAVFDGIMETVGNDGRFQRRFKYIFNIAMVICVSMLYMNLVLAMSVPDHWCHVPGREQSNLSDAQWKRLTLPRSLDNRGMETYSSCQMFANLDTNKLLDYHQSVTADPDGDHQFPFNETTSCLFGYEYDATYYGLTAVSQQNWVCDKDLYVTNTFVFNRLGEVVGTLIVGQIGDYFGRRLAFYFSNIFGFFGSVVVMISSHNYVLFCISAIINGVALMSLFQAPLIISLETSDAESRGKIAMWQCIGWTVGLCILPMLLWVIGDWVWFMLASSVPTLVFLLFPRYMIESPRWLANKKQYGKCAVMLNRIAKINRREIRYSESALREAFGNTKEEKTYGMVSLFSHWRLVKNTIILILGRTITNIAYFTIMLNCSKVAGNPFMNFLWQSAIELPAFILGQYCADKFGRRFTNSVAFIGAGVVCVPVMILVNDPQLENYAIWGVISMKFFVGITFFISNLQGMETYPTCLRQTGVSVGTISANLIGMVGPYIVRLGTHVDSRYPYLILLIFFCVCGITIPFLPETLHEKLPESLRDAEEFGKDQPFWYIPKAKHVTLDRNDHLLQKLNCYESQN